MTEIRIDVDKETYARWRGEATDLGIRLTQYVRMLAKGQIGQPVITAAIPVQSARVAVGSIGSRLLAAMEQQGKRVLCEGPELRLHALSLGVTKPQLLGALGSLVASKRMMHHDGAYHIVKEDTPIKGD